MLVQVPGYAKVLVKAVIGEVGRLYARLMPYDWDQASDPDLVPGMKWREGMNRPEAREEAEGPNLEFGGIKLWFSREPGNNTRSNNSHITPGEWAVWYEEFTAELKRQEEKRILQLPKKNEDGVGV